MNLLLVAVTNVETVNGMSKIIFDYGMMVAVCAVFLLIVLAMFWIITKRTSAMYSNNAKQSSMLLKKIMDDSQERTKEKEEKDQKFKSDFSILVKTITDIFNMVKENNEDITNRSKRYITYSGTIKMFKNYFGNMKYEILRECEEIILKNHIDNNERIHNKVLLLTTNMDKKRNVDFREFYFERVCLSNILPCTISKDIMSMMEEYIHDKDRNIGKLRNDLDNICINYMNDIEDHIQGILKKTND